LFYGDRYGIDFKKISVIRYEKYKNTSIEELHQTTSMIALYDKRVVEMGPRARLVLFRDLADRSLLALQMARFMEIDLALQRVAELLECVRLTAPVRSMVMVYEHGRGVGVYEAPRGTLVHYVELSDEGRVREYRIIVPTMFNIPVIEQALRGLPVDVADLIPRLFDPCIPCSTHIVRVRK